eukprot:TRINITY_DN14295_c0_g2_i2.p1 TRINITY_DN14295_c0_g2~~TRINITY_DN14295_c0_g2_i2.p1  ORF type:complete len:1205 (+),score=342.52 TRINITY_DN14295_c0_g2_i2:101-3715(+)
MPHTAKGAGRASARQPSACPWQCVSRDIAWCAACFDHPHGAGECVIAGWEGRSCVVALPVSADRVDLSQAVTAVAAVLGQGPSQAGCWEKISCESWGVGVRWCDQYTAPHAAPVEELLQRMLQRMRYARAAGMSACMCTPKRWESAQLRAVLQVAAGLNVALSTTTPAEAAWASGTGQPLDGAFAVQGSLQVFLLGQPGVPDYSAELVDLQLPETGMVTDLTGGLKAALGGFLERFGAGRKLRMGLCNAASPLPCGVEIVHLEPADVLSGLMQILRDRALPRHHRLGRMPSKCGGAGGTAALHLLWQLRWGLEPLPEPLRVAFGAVATEGGAVPLSGFAGLLPRACVKRGAAPGDILCHIRDSTPPGAASRGLTDRLRACAVRSGGGDESPLLGPVLVDGTQDLVEAARRALAALCMRPPLQQQQQQQQVSGDVPAAQREGKHRPEAITLPHMVVFECAPRPKGACRLGSLADLELHAALPARPAASGVAQIMRRLGGSDCDGAASAVECNRRALVAVITASQSYVQCRVGEALHWLRLRLGEHTEVVPTSQVADDLDRWGPVGCPWGAVTLVYASPQLVGAMGTPIAGERWLSQEHLLGAEAIAADWEADYQCNIVQPAQQNHRLVRRHGRSRQQLVDEHESTAAATTREMQRALRRLKGQAEREHEQAVEQLAKRLKQQRRADEAQEKQERLAVADQQEKRWGELERKVAAIADRQQAAERLRRTALAQAEGAQAQGRRKLERGEATARGALWRALEGDARRHVAARYDDLARAAAPCLGYLAERAAAERREQSERASIGLRALSALELARRRAAAAAQSADWHTLTDAFASSTPPELPARDTSSARSSAGRGDPWGAAGLMSSASSRSPPHPAGHSAAPRRLLGDDWDDDDLLFACTEPLGPPQACQGPRGDETDPGSAKASPVHRTPGPESMFVGVLDAPPHFPAAALGEDCVFDDVEFACTIGELGPAPPQQPQPRPGYGHLCTPQHWREPSVDFPSGGGGPLLGSTPPPPHPASAGPSPPSPPRDWDPNAAPGECGPALGGGDPFPPLPVVGHHCAEPLAKAHWNIAAEPFFPANLLPSAVDPPGPVPPRELPAKQLLPLARQQRPARCTPPPAPARSSPKNGARRTKPAPRSGDQPSHRLFCPFHFPTEPFRLSESDPKPEVLKVLGRVDALARRLAHYRELLLERVETAPKAKAAD